MPKYIVRKTYQYSEMVEIEADNRKEAEDLAQSTEGERIYDDHLYDCVIEKEIDD